MIFLRLRRESVCFLGSTVRKCQRHAQLQSCALSRLRLYFQERSFQLRARLWLPLTPPTLQADLAQQQFQQRVAQQRALRAVQRSPSLG